ncbi:MAG: hypothetical protein AW12_01149 [Candidatus Accumulibacter sp. BA-94]|nr:MAG: hypothetical protein AW12_01149 [Candidatus Accumulibacter sp. BA-94]
MRPLRVSAAAGLTPGSTPTTASSGKCSRKAATAATVAVLQATTMTPQPASTSLPPIRRTRLRM